MPDISDRSLEGRIAIVTGASRGIGAAIAQRLASAGATVVCAARSVGAADGDVAGTAGATVAAIERAGGTALALRCDVEDAASRAKLIAQTTECFGRLDILVNNAGTSILQTVPQMDMATCRAQAEQYLFGPLDLALQAAEIMRRGGRGWIVNLGSSSALPVDVAAQLGTAAGATLAFYGAVKAAVHRLSQGMALGLYEDNIAVHVVAPVAVIDTPGIRAQGVITPAVEPYLERVEHLAEAVVALCEKPAGERTGEIAWAWKYLDQIGRSTWSLDGRTVIEHRGQA